MASPEKGSPEWFEMKQQARQDLDTRLSLGLPHSSKPLGKVAAAIGFEPVAKAPRKRAKK